jgi:beta-lactamase regulating signal transducer with metallopeptidase domain
MAFEGASLRLAETLWRASWQAGIFVAAIWVVCRVWRTIPAGCRYGLWWLACAQFLVRLATPLPVTAPDFLIQPTAVAPLAAQPVEQFRPSIEPQAAQMRARVESPKHAAYRQPARPFAVAHVPTQLPLLESAATKNSNLWVLFAGIYLLGVCGLLGRQVLRAGKTLKLLQGLQLLENEDVAQVLAEVEPLAKRRPKVYESDDVSCPLLAGWLKPRIVLPSGLAQRLSEAELRMLLAHEVAHARRGDLWLALIPAVARSVFYFHPLVWLAAAETKVACEESCDLEALRLTGGSAAAYARLLIDTATGSTNLVAVGAAFGFSTLRRRISMLNRSTRSSIPRRASLGLLAFAAICGLPFTVTAQSAKKIGSHAKNSVASNKMERAKLKHELAIYRAKETEMKALVVRKLNAAQEAARDSQRLALIQQVEAALVQKIEGSTGKPPPPPARPVALALVRDNPPFGVSVRSVPMPSPAVESDVLVAPPQAVDPATPVGIAPPSPVQFQKLSSVREFGISGQLAPVAVARDAFKANKASATSMPILESRAAISGQQTLSGDDQVGQRQFGPVVHEIEHDGSTVNIKFRNVELHEALSDLFDAMNVDYVINSQVGTDRVTCSLHGADVYTAVQAIFHAVNLKLTYRIEAGRYEIKQETSSQPTRAGGSG